MDFSDCRKLHNRNIDITTYAYEADAVALEGRLFDTRTGVSYNMFGEPREPGPVHDLIVRMIVRLPKLVIEDVAVEMVTVPNVDCPEVADSLTPLKGERISAGFTTRVHRLVGGPKGCAHLVSLCRAMASAAVQGAYSLASRRPPSPNRYSSSSYKTVIDTCHIWRSDGPLVKRLNETITANDASS